MLSELLRVDAKLSTRREIPEVAVPTMRAKLSQLAYALNLRSGYTGPNAHAWLERLSDDPLPELRLRRYEQHVTER